MHLAGCVPPFEDSPHNRCLGVGSTNSDSSLTFNPWYTQTNRQSVNSTPKCRSIGILTDIYLAFFLWRYPTKSENENVEFSKKSSLAILHVFNVFSESALAEPHFDVNSTETN